MSDERISEAFDLIARYATRHGWIPIGFRSWDLGPWRITVNGTPTERENIPPFHALIEHTGYVGLMLVSPFGGTVGGFKGTEDEFIAAMRAANEREATV